MDGLSLEVLRGECFGLLGPNGAGKTTTIEILEGLLTPDSGDVEVLGLRWQRDERQLRQRLGIQLQESQFIDKLTVEETLRVFRSFYDRGKTIDELLALVELESKRASWVVKLSGGKSSGCRSPARSSAIRTCSSRRAVRDSTRNHAGSCGVCCSAIAAAVAPSC